MKTWVGCFVVGLMLASTPLLAQERALVESFKRALLPARTAVTTVTDGPTLVMNLEFGRNSYDVTPEVRRYLDALGTALTEGNEMRHYVYRIEGHTCDLGAAEYNDWLSQKRAEAVVDYLVTHFELRRPQFRIVGYGEARPIAPNTTEAERRKNRRVTVVNTLQKMMPPEPSAALPPTATPVLTAAPGKDTPLALPQLRLDVQVKYVRAGRVEELSDDVTLTQRDGYAVEFISKNLAYIYLCQADAYGEVERLFPNASYVNEVNPATPGKLYRVPELGKWFYLDGRKGREHIVVLAHREKLRDPAGLCRQALGSSVKIASRGVGGIRQVASPVAATATDLAAEPAAVDLNYLFVWKRSFLHQ